MLKWARHSEVRVLWSAVAIDTALPLGLSKRRRRFACRRTPHSVWTKKGRPFLVGLFEEISQLLAEAEQQCSCAQHSERYGGRLRNHRSRGGAWRRAGRNRAGSSCTREGERRHVDQLGRRRCTTTERIAEWSRLALERGGV